MKEAMMIKPFCIALLLTGCLYADEVSDTDFDGVPDRLDECPNTPFLHQVNAKGCTTVELRLPDETDRDSMTMTLSSGYQKNDDLPNYLKQYKTKVQLNYYHNDWAYSIRTSYNTKEENDGFGDTTLKVRKRFRPNDAVRINLGIGVKLPTYDYPGNKTDYKLYSSLYYYPEEGLSLFGGLNYTFIQDDEVMGALQNKSNLFLGAGYFFTQSFYANLGYSYEQSKYVEEHAEHALSVTLFYQITDRWFASVYYKQDILDEDFHDELYFNLGYKFW